MALELQGSGVETLEAKLNVMQAVFLVIQTSLSLKADSLEKGRGIFLTLFNKYFTEASEVPIHDSLSREMQVNDITNSCMRTFSPS